MGIFQCSCEHGKALTWPKVHIWTHFPFVHSKISSMKKKHIQQIVQNPEWEASTWTMAEIFGEFQHWLRYCIF